MIEWRSQIVHAGSYYAHPPSVGLGRKPWGFWFVSVRGVGIVARMSIVSGSVKRVISLVCATTGTHHLYSEMTGNGLGLSWFRRAFQISSRVGAPSEGDRRCPAHGHMPHHERGGRVHALWRTAVALYTAER